MDRDEAEKKMAGAGLTRGEHLAHSLMDIIPDDTAALLVTPKGATALLFPKDVSDGEMPPAWQALAAVAIRLDRDMMFLEEQVEWFCENTTSGRKS